LPDELKVPEELIYCFMAHYISKLYGIPPPEAFKLTQGDFITAVMFEQLEHKRQKYLMELLATDS